MTGPGASLFGEEERAAVLAVLDSGHLSRFGDLDDPRFLHKVYDLERGFAQQIGVGFAVATSSGTAALLLSLLAAGIGEGDEVLVPGFTYVATIAAIVNARATPVLVEIDESLTIDPGDLRQKITSRTVAVVVVHMLGNPCDMEAVMTIATENGLVVIEDACQAAGASYKSWRVGSLGNFGAFSFNRYKMLAAGEGGMVTTNQRELYERVFALHDQGHTPLRATKERSESSLVGFNFKMNELTGAVALAQLAKLESMLTRLRTVKRALRASLPNLPQEVARYRRINDSEGECATFLAILFRDPATADRVADALGTRTLTHSGWHNYALMDHIAQHRVATSRWLGQVRYGQPGDLPATDSLLARCVNVSIGVTDSALAADVGLDVRSGPDHVALAAARIRAALELA